MGPATLLEMVALMGSALMGSALMGSSLVGGSLVGTSLMGSLVGVAAVAASEATSSEATSSEATTTAVSTFQPEGPYTHCNTGDLYITAYINITFQDKNNNTYTENSEIAKFGEGVMVGSAHGQLVHVISAPGYGKTKPPESGCEYPLMSASASGSGAASLPSGPWIALIRRGDCSFDDKVRSAHKSHASAVIIYNNQESDSLDKMKLSRIGNITAVFTYKKKGEWMARLVDDGIHVTASISVGSRCARNLNPIHRTSVLFVSISFIVLMVISLAWLVFYYVQRFRYIHAKDRLSRRLCTAAKKALSKIPTKNIKADDKEVIGDGECCPVCIDPYKVQDTVRILPCWHEFHKSCIDPWLLDHRTCPMCKMDILRHYGFVLTGSQESILQFHAEEVPNLSHQQLTRASLHVALPPENAMRSPELPTSSRTTSDNPSTGRECPA